MGVTAVIEFFKMQNPSHEIWIANGELGEKYDRLCTEMDAFMEAQRCVASALKEFCLASGKIKCELLEIGLGTGITTDAALQAAQSATVTVIEPDPAMIARAERRIVNDWTRSRIDFQGSDFLSFCQNANAAGRQWDAAYSAFTLHNLPDVEQDEILKGIHALIRPGGFLYLADYAIKTPADRLQAFKSHAEELFNILGRDNHYALRDWILHTFDDMQESRVRNLSVLKQAILTAGFVDCKCQFTGNLEAFFVARA